VFLMAQSTRTTTRYNARILKDGKIMIIPMELLIIGGCTSIGLVSVWFFKELDEEVKQLKIIRKNLEEKYKSKGLPWCLCEQLKGDNKVHHMDILLSTIEKFQQELNRTE